MNDIPSLPDDNISLTFKTQIYNMDEENWVSLPKGNFRDDGMIIPSSLFVFP